MTEKRKPSYDLEKFRAVCGNIKRLSMTKTAYLSALELGFDEKGVAGVIKSMEGKHFYKSMTSYADHKRWQDVYHVPSEAGMLYVKFTEDAVTEFLLLSFKEK